MRWPWVSRLRLEEELRHHKLLRAMLTETKDDVRELRAQVVGLHASHQERTDEFIKTITHMRREEGFQPPISQEIAVELEDDMPAAVWEAINEVSVKGSPDYFVNVTHARAALKAGDPQAEIVELIIKGQDVEV